MNNHSHDEQEWVLEFLPSSRPAGPVKEGGESRPFVLPSSLRHMAVVVPIVLLFLLILGIWYGPKTPNALSYHSWHALQYTRVLEREIGVLVQDMEKATQLKAANPIEVQQTVTDMLATLGRLKAEHEQSPADYPQTKSAALAAMEAVGTYVNTLSVKKNETALKQFDPNSVAAEETAAQSSIEVLRKQVQWIKEGAGF